MELTMSQYIDKLEGLMETAIYNYEVEVLSEAAEAAEGAESKEALAAKAKGKMGSVGKLISNALRTIWLKVQDFIYAMVEKYDRLIRFRNVDIVVTKEDNIKIHADSTIYNPKFAAILSAMSSRTLTQEDVDKAAQEVDSLNTKDKWIPVIGEVGKNKLLAMSRVAKRYAVLAKKAANASNSFSTTEMQSTVLSGAKNVLTKLADILTKAIGSANNIKEIKTATQDKKIADYTANKMGEKAEKRQQRRDKKFQKEYDRAKAKGDTQNESTEMVSDLLRTAAMLLNESGIDQDDIEDIPEERPVYDDEYPADDITGGAGAKLSCDEIKDLVGDDKEAIAILADDEGSKAITESVIITF